MICNHAGQLLSQRDVMTFYVGWCQLHNFGKLARILFGKFCREIVERLTGNGGQMIDLDAIRRLSKVKSVPGWEEKLMLQSRSKFFTTYNDILQLLWD